MTEPTREQLLAQMADMQRRMDEMQKKLQAQNVGNGAVAQDGSAAAGAGGVAVKGDIHGNIYTGQPTQNPNEALGIYRRGLVSGCRRLPLRGVDLGASDAAGSQTQLDLDQVDVALDTTHTIGLAHG
jgi:hypothetical protein